MGLSLKPEHLRRYRDMAVLLLKYGRSDMIFNAGIGMDEPDPEDSNEAANGAELANDLEALGPTFVKVGQLLSTRADLLPPETLRSLSRLQDDVAPFPFEDVERIVTEELGVRISKAFSRFDAERRGGDRLGFEDRKHLRELDADLRFDDALDVGVRERRDIVLEARERVDIGWRQQIGAAGEQLAKLDERRPEPLEVVGQAPCVVGAIANAVGLLLRAAERGTMSQ